VYSELETKVYGGVRCMLRLDVWWCWVFGARSLNRPAPSDRVQGPTELTGEWVNLLQELTVFPVSCIC
jgi:hypothetical protein